MRLMGLEGQHPSLHQAPFKALCQILYSFRSFLLEGASTVYKLQACDRWSHPLPFDASVVLTEGAGSVPSPPPQPRPILEPGPDLWPTFQREPSRSNGAPVPILSLQRPPAFPLALVRSFCRENTPASQGVDGDTEQSQAAQPTANPQHSREPT